MELRNVQSGYLESRVISYTAVKHEIIWRSKCSFRAITTTNCLRVSEGDKAEIRHVINSVFLCFFISELTCQHPATALKVCRADLEASQDHSGKVINRTSQSFVNKILTSYTMDKISINAQVEQMDQTDKIQKF